MDVDEFGQHISRSFNDDLEKVRNSVLTMGGLVKTEFRTECGQRSGPEGRAR